MAKSVDMFAVEVEPELGCRCLPARPHHATEVDLRFGLDSSAMFSGDFTYCRRMRNERTKFIIVPLQYFQ
jgi:hypothetical protein